MTPGFQQKSVFRGERVFKTTRTRQLTLAFNGLKCLGFAMVWFGSSPAEKLFSFRRRALCNIFFAEMM